jgi:hypothetical protein
MDTTFWFETLGTYIDHSTNNIHQDCVFLGYASPSDIVFAGGSDLDSLGKSLEHWQTVNLLCLGSNGQPVPLAGIWYGNAHNEGFAGNSDIDGWFRKAFKVRYDHQDYVLTDGINPGDSTFNPFIFTAYTFLGDDTATTTISLSPTVYTDTLIFDNTTGVIPPSGTKIIIRKLNNDPSDDIEIIGPPIP